MRTAILERRINARAVALALDPACRLEDAAESLAALAAVDPRALERVVARWRKVTRPSGLLSERILASLCAALDSLRSQPADGTGRAEPR